MFKKLMLSLIVFTAAPSFAMHSEKSESRLARIQNSVFDMASFVRKKIVDNQGKIFTVAISGLIASIILIKKQQPDFNQNIERLNELIRLQNQRVVDLEWHAYDANIELNSLRARMQDLEFREARPFDRESYLENDDSFRTLRDRVAAVEAQIRWDN